MTNTLLLSLSIPERRNFLGNIMLAAQDDAYFMEFAEIVASAHAKGFYDNVRVIDETHPDISDVDNKIENGPHTS